jgi:hypothetical protein
MLLKEACRNEMVLIKNILFAFKGTFDYIPRDKCEHMMLVTTSTTKIETNRHNGMREKTQIINIRTDPARPRARHRSNYQ